MMCSVTRKNIFIFFIFSFCRKLKKVFTCGKQTDFLIKKEIYQDYNYFSEKD